MQSLNNILLILICSCVFSASPLFGDVVVQYEFSGTVSSDFALTGDAGGGINAGDSWEVRLLVDSCAIDMSSNSNFGNFNAILSSSIAFESGFEDSLSFSMPEGITFNNNRPAFMGGVTIDRIIASGTTPTLESFSVRAETANLSVLNDDGLIVTGSFLFDDSGDDQGSLDWTGTGVDGLPLEFFDSGAFDSNDYPIQLVVRAVPEPSPVLLVLTLGNVMLLRRFRTPTRLRRTPKPASW